MNIKLTLLLAGIGTIYGCSQTPVVTNNEQGFCSERSMFPKGGDLNQIICNEDFALGYNYATKSPIWSIYKLSIRSSVDESVRLSEFLVNDPRVPKEHQTEIGDYLNSNYIKGSLVNPEALRTSQKSMNEGHYFSNAVPQLSKFARYQYNSHGAWGALEDIENQWMIEKKNLWVFAGPVYEQSSKTAGGLLIPSHFYKVYYDEKLNSTISFLIPHGDNGARQLGEHISSVDCIEEVTGLDLLSKLPDPVENDLENATAKDFEFWVTKDNKTKNIMCGKGIYE